MTTPHDKTARRASDGTEYAAPSCASLEAAVAHVRGLIVASGGYDMLVGFSQGGLVLAVLLKGILELNARTRVPVTRFAIFGTRELYSDKYGAPVFTLEPPLSIKGFFAHGRKDDNWLRHGLDPSDPETTLRDLRECAPHTPLSPAHARLPALHQR